MKVWKIILAAAIIFVTGAVTGTVAYTQFIQKKSHQEKQFPATPKMPGPDFWKWMGRELQLTEEQKQKIDQIVNDSHERLKPLRELIDPIMQEELKRVYSEICKVLTEEQKKKYDAFIFRKPPPRQPGGRTQGKSPEFRPGQGPPTGRPGMGGPDSGRPQGFRGPPSPAQPPPPQEKNE